MTCTQCSGSHGLAASEAPWGQDLPLTSACTLHTDSSLRKRSARGSRHLPLKPGQAAKGAAGHTKGDEPWVPQSVPYNLFLLLGGPVGPYVLLPLSVSFCAAMFLCCQIGPLSPFQFYLGERQGFCRPMPWAPSLGTVDTKCLA